MKISTRPGSRARRLPSSLSLLSLPRTDDGDIGGAALHDPALPAADGLVLRHGAARAWLGLAGLVVIRFPAFALGLAALIAVGIPTPALGAPNPSDGNPVDEPPPISKLPSVKAFSEAIYPPAALRDRVAASIVLELDINREGLVDSVVVASSSTVAEAGGRAFTGTSTITDYGFERAAAAAGAKLVFEPAEAGGEPVPVRIAYTYRFDLPARARSEAALASTSTVVSTSTTPGGAGEGIVRLRGVVREAGTRRLIPGVMVTVFRSDGGSAAQPTASDPSGPQSSTRPPSQAFETTTNEKGEFEFFDLAPGKWRVLAEIDGYYPFRTAEEIVEDEVVEATYFLERGSYNPYDVLVEAERVQKEVNRRTLKAAEIVKVPGTLGDPINVVENLPGVARTPGGGGAIIVRGSGPEDTGVFVDGIEVPLIYHFGGLKSIVPAEVIDEIEFFPGNFSLQYGRATGGIFNAKTKRSTSEQFSGSLDVSLLDTSLYLEVPIGKELTIGLAGRRSYIDFVLKAVIPDDSSVSLVSAPRYYDYQAFATWRPAAGHEARLFFFGSDDSVSLLFDDPADIDAQLKGTNLDAKVFFNRLIASYDYLPSKEFQNRFKIAAARDAFRISAFDQFGTSIDYRNIQFRENARWAPTDGFALDFGFEGVAGLVDVDVTATRPPKEGEVVFTQDLDDVIVVSLKDVLVLELAPFAEAEISLTDALKVLPGLRLDYFHTIDSVTVDPRIIARYDLGEGWTAKAGVGVTHQPPSEDETAEGFGNPDLGPERAIQVSAGAEWAPTDYLKLDGTLFYKDLDHLVSRSNATTVVDGRVEPLVYDNGGRGRVFGAELFVEHKFNQNFRGWLSYTLSRAVRTDSGETTSRLFDFDQTHILALVASYTFPENWEVGVRWRLVSGNPTTPFAGGVFLSDFDRFAPIPARVNSTRLPIFHQLDVRFEKRWIYDFWTFSAYLNLVNAYNRANVEGLSYNFDYTQSDTVSGLPIFPILGVKAEF